MGIITLMLYHLCYFLCYNNDMNNICRNFQYLLALKNLNCNQLAQAINIPAMTTNRIARGKITDPKISTLIKIVSYLRVNLDDFVLNDLENLHIVRTILANATVHIPYIDLQKLAQRDSQHFLPTIAIPKLLVLGQLSDMFATNVPNDYSVIFPDDAVLVFNKKKVAAIGEIVVCRNQLLNNVILARVTDETNGSKLENILTNQIMDDSQYVFLATMVGQVFIACA